MTLALLLTAVGGAWADEVKYPIVYDFEAAANAGEDPINKNGSEVNGQKFYGWENETYTDRERKDYKGYEYAEGSVLPKVCHVWRRGDRINGNVNGYGGLKCPSNKQMAVDGLTEGLTVTIIYDATNATDKEIVWAIGDGSSSQLTQPRATATINGVEAVPGQTTIKSGDVITVNSVTEAQNGSGYIVFKVMKDMVIKKIIIDEAKAASGIKVTTNAVEEGATFTQASFQMQTFDVDVNYTLVRDMQDQTSPVAFSGLPSSGNIVVKKGSDGKYQPAGDFAIKLLDGTQDIITNEDINVQVIIQKENELGAIDDDPDKEPITLTAFLSDMTPGYYRLKAEASENGAYDGTVYSTYLTVEEKYNLLVKPANDFSAGKLDAVTVAGQTATPNADGIINGVNPADEVKIKAKRGYIIEKVEGKKGAGLTYPIALSEVTEEYLGKVIGSDAKVYATAAAAQAAGTQAVAMIVYVGSETDNTTYNHGLALALANEDVTTNWPTAKAACRDKTPTVGRALWMLPSKTQWETMINAAGSDTALREAFSAVGGTNLNASYYWSSTQSNSSSAWDYDFLHRAWDSSVKNTDLYVRACLAF